MGTIVAKTEHLSKSFGDNLVLKDVNLELMAGENLVILGKSGSGKSVLIKCMVGLELPDEGAVTLFGKNISGLSIDALNTVRKKIGFLFQSAALYDSMTVRENLEFPLREMKSISEADKEAMVAEALKNVGLENTADKMPSELSGGMKKRIGLARTLIQKPEIILYDEPTTGLDPITSQEISRLILEVQEKYHTASIVITHDMECAKITANRMMIIRDGRIYATGSYNELSRSVDEWVSSFFKHV